MHLEIEAVHLIPTNCTAMPNTILQLSDFQCSISEHRSTHEVFRYHDPSACITFACAWMGLKVRFLICFFPVSLA